MKKEFMLLAIVPMLSMGTLHATDITEKVSAKLEQKGVTLEGANAQLSDKLTFQFDASGNLVMTLGDDDTPVAVTPIKNGASMVVDCNAASTVEERTVPVGAGGYTAIISAFQLVVPEGVEVYAPTFDAEKAALVLSNETRLSAGTVIPAGTGVIVKSASGSCAFESTIQSNVAPIASVLKGSAVVDTLALEPTDVLYLLDTAQGLNLVKATSNVVAAGQAYLVFAGSSAPSQISLDNQTTALRVLDVTTSGKREYYNLQGVRVLNPTQGIYVNENKKVLTK